MPLKLHLALFVALFTLGWQSKTAFESSVTSCPFLFEPWVSGRCMAMTPYKQTLDQLVDLCALMDGSFPVSIHSAQENDRIRSIVDGEQYVGIGLKCNANTHRFEWMDGSKCDYSNLINDSPCDGVPRLVVMRISDGAWMTMDIRNAEKGICALTRLNNPACEDYEYVKGSRTCVSLRNKEPAYWSFAEKACKDDSAHLVSIHDQQTNDYLLSHAKELGIKEGLHIGLQTFVSKAEKRWTDGSNFTYSNFARGFPSDLFGHCTAMHTTSATGEWLTNNCASSKLLYACSRQGYDIENPIAPAGCPKQQYYFHNGTIYSPSYPAAPNVTSCEYFLAVDEGARLRLTIDDFSMNKCCDKIELFDGALGGQRIATVTGQVDPGTSFQTSSSNIMHVVLTTNDGSLVRGFRAHFGKYA